MMQIIPDTEKYSEVENVARIEFCYLHGKLEDMAGYDCFGFTNLDVETSDMGYAQSCDVKDGIYDCEFEGKPCTFFFWKSTGLIERNRGLAVFNDDAEAYEYAQKCYNKKQSVL